MSERVVVRRARIPLEEAIRDPGFTPRVDDIIALVELLLDEELFKHAQASIVRSGPAALEILRARFEHATPPLRGHLLRAIGAIGANRRNSAGSADEKVRSLLIGALDDSDAKTRRNAVIALGRDREAYGVEDALIRTWDRDPRPEMRRSIAASLGKVGSTRSLAILRDAAADEDAALARIAERAVSMIERTESRAGRGRLDGERAADMPVDVEVFARRGLEELLCEELKHIEGVADVQVVGPGRVRARLAAAMQALFAARTMLSFRFPLPAERHLHDETQQEAIARAASSAAAKRIFTAWTVGQVRYRIAWTERGHKRAATWETARAIARRAPELINDPTASLWELVIASGGGYADVALAPRGLPDPRFWWRRSDVPAASHPTIAAALVMVAGVRANDVVWDPFVGSGAELIERALAGPYRSIMGTDTNSKALAAARENLRAARVRAHLQRADALVHAPQGVTLVITNPPMGRRAARTPRLRDTLDAFLAHATSILAREGRLVWMAPWPERARAAGARAGLVLDSARTVDMGGFDAEMQRWIKR